MKRLTQTQFEYELKKIKNENIFKERNIKLQKERNKYKYKYKLEIPSTSKLIAIYLFLILNVVLIFSMVSMWHFSDLSYLGVLITDVAAQILTYLIYTRKAIVENQKGGITYDLAMMNQNINDVSN